MDFIEDAEFRILRDVDSDNNRRYVTAQLIAELDLFKLQIIFGN